MVRKFDFLVIGKKCRNELVVKVVSKKVSVALICKAGLEEANTYYAQGAAVNKSEGGQF